MGLVIHLSIKQQKEFDIRRGEFNDRAALDILLQSHDLVTNYQSEVKNDFQWSTGFSAELQDNFQIQALELE